MVSYLLSKKIFASQIAGQRLSSIDPDKNDHLGGAFTLAGN